MVRILFTSGHDAELQTNTGEILLCQYRKHHSTIFITNPIQQQHQQQYAIFGWRTERCIDALLISPDTH